MSKEYIDKEVALALTKHLDRKNGNKHFVYGVDTYAEYLQELSPADVKPVVLCKDCKHNYADLCGLTCSHGVCVDSIVAPNFYCANGERSEENK